MKITVYELLGMIKDDKAPKKVKYKNRILYLEDEAENYEPTFNYYDKDGENALFEGWIGQYLNDEVEILEEEKKIPEKLGAINYTEDKATALIHRKVDEIIDYLNYLENKGE